MEMANACCKKCKCFNSLLSECSIHKACRRIQETDKQIQTVDMEPDYDSSNTFIKIFKSSSGVSPAA